MEKPKTCVYRSKKIYKTSENSTDQSESQKIYASMACMFSNVKTPRRNYGDNLQLTNWILDSIATCHMTSEISYFIPGSLVETDMYILKLQMGIFHSETNRTSSNRNKL